MKTDESSVVYAATCQSEMQEHTNPQTIVTVLSSSSSTGICCVFQLIVLGSQPACFTSHSGSLSSAAQQEKRHFPSAAPIAKHFPQTSVETIKELKEKRNVTEMR